MSLWKIAWRSIQQRGWASVLTMLSMALGVGLVVVVVTIHGVVEESFRSNATLGYNMIVGAKGGALQLTLNTVYYLSQPVENIPYDYYLEFLSPERREAEMVHSNRYQASQAEWETADIDSLSAVASMSPGLSSIGSLLALEAAAEIDESAMRLHEKGKYSGYVNFAIPLCLGDYFGNFRVIGTTPAFFEDVIYDPERERRYEISNVSDLKAAEATFRRLDQDRDGTVELDELTAAQQKLDANGNGIVESSELGDDELGDPIPTPPWLKDVERILHLADVNDDRRLTNEELAACHDQYPRPFEYNSGRFGFFEAVVGATVAREMGVQLGEQLAPAHGAPEGAIHDQRFTVVGILEPTGTPNDRAVFVNMEGFFLMASHAKPIAEEQPVPPEQPPTPVPEAPQPTQGTYVPLPIEQREVTALLVQTRRALFAYKLTGPIDEGSLDDSMLWSEFRPERNQKSAQAVLPAAEINGLFEIIVKPIQWTLLLLTGMICIVSGVSILVSIYNSMSDRRHEIAVMRALGAGRSTVTTTIFLESVILSMGGALIGWIAAHGVNHLASPSIEERTGVTLRFWQFAPGWTVDQFSESWHPFAVSAISITIVVLIRLLVGGGWVWLIVMGLINAKSADNAGRARATVALDAACGVVVTSCLIGIWNYSANIGQNLAMLAYVGLIVGYVGYGLIRRKEFKWAYSTMGVGYCLPLLSMVQSISIEAILIPAVVVLAIIVGILPAMAAYRTDVAESLGK